MKSIRAGILIAIATAGSLSCGESEFTQPNPTDEIVAVQAWERFASGESRELLINGEATDIEWDLTGDPSIILMQGASGGGGSYYVSVRSMWTLDNFGAPDGILFLVQWPDGSEDRLEEPLVTNVDVATVSDTLDCTTDNRLVREESWTRSNIQEDEVTIELFSNELESYPKDVWRWGASTTDFATPVNPTEWQGATTDANGSTTHPSASTMEDFYDTGGGLIRDAARLKTYIPNHAPGSSVPLRLVDKGTRDARLNRGKPVNFVVWDLVSKVLSQCEILNPIRLDDASLLEKTWNPGDYVPSYRLTVADSSQADVIAKGAWLAGKWSLEIRRDLIPRESGIAEGDPDNQPNPRVDDLQLQYGRRYSVRITIKDGLTKSVSQSGIIPIFLRPDNP